MPGPVPQEVGQGVLASGQWPSDERCSRLLHSGYRCGYESTRRFLLDEFDWHEHLKTRGFRPSRKDGDQADRWETSVAVSSGV